MWTEAINGVSGLIGALAAFIVALTGLWGILRKVTRGKGAGTPIESGVEVSVSFDYVAEWQLERDRANKLDADNDALRSYVHKLELILTRNNIPF